MSRALTKGLFLVTLLVVGTFSLAVFPVVQAVEKPVTAKSIAYEGTTIIEYQNSQDSGIDIESIRMWLSKEVNFKSFKTEKGWVGKKSLTGVITFTATESVKPGESVKFGIKTDKTNPAINWKAFDGKGNQIATAKTLVSAQESKPKDSTPGETTTKINGNSAIFDNSVFRLIPSEPKVGSSIRVLGENFGAVKDLEFYIGNKKIKSFTSNDDGSFTVTIKVPENQPAERTDFIVKDLLGNQRSMSLRIKESDSRILTPEEIRLTIHTYGDVFYRGQEVEISGTAAPLSTVTISITNPDGEQVSTIVVEPDIKGNFVTTHMVPLDAMFGKYVSDVSDGKTSIKHRFSIETAQKIVIIPAKEFFEPGETVLFNGTAIPDEELEIVIEDPTGKEVISTIIDVRSSGKFDYEFLLDDAAIKGTWVLFAAQGGETEIFLIGVGQLPEPQLVIRADKLNYKANENALLEISGPAST
ncbi:MAG: biofilm-associated protein, partial [Nitrosopumilaceae archaeon]